MRKSKILMVMTALVLVVVGVLAAVTSVLSAQQQSVTSSLQVSYVANNVSATVSVASKTQSGTFSAPTDGTNNTALQTVTFGPSDGESSTTALVANNVALGGFSGEIFQRYAVYKFSFQNKYASTSHGTAMAVTMKYTAPTGDNNKNVTLLWMTAKNETEPAHAINGNAWSTTGLTVAADGTSTNVFTGADKVIQNSTYHLYLYVMIVDVTKPATFALNGTDNGKLTFTLDGAAN